MDRRQFSAALAGLGAGLLLVACGQTSAEPSPTFHPEETARRLAELGGEGTVRALVASPLQGEALTPGLFVYNGVRARDAGGILRVSYLVGPGYHQLNYRVFGSPLAAREYYLPVVAGFGGDPRGTPGPLDALPYPALLLAYDDMGIAAALVGPVVVTVVATGSTRARIVALTLAGVAHLERMAGATEG